VKISDHTYIRRRNVEVIVELARSVER